MLLVVAVIFFASSFPISFRPELRVRHMLRRFFKSCEYLIAEGNPPSKLSRLQRWRHAFHLQEVMTIPAKLVPWASVLSPDALGNSSPAQMQETVSRMQVLGGYVQELIAVREETGIEEKTAHEIQDYIRTWRQGFKELFARLSMKPDALEQYHIEYNPDAEDDASLRSALDDVLERLEARIEQALNADKSQSWRPDNEDNEYQLLGVYRGLSEALVAYAKSARGVDWSNLAESRF